jgi:hypothetical protein
MAQQTAMQQAISHYEKLAERGSDQAWLIAEYLKENYLELEKEHIAKAWDAGYYGYFILGIILGIREIEFKNGEEYYEENYKNK